MSDALILDTSGLLAALDVDEPDHEAARAAVEAATGPLVMSPFVLAELDYLLLTHVGPAAEVALLEQVRADAYALAPFDRGDVASALTVVQRYHDLALGLADASVVVLAERHATTSLLTLDERRFRAVRTPTGGYFTLLPADA